jgi:hypothetical protein
VLEKLNWASNTLRLGKWSVARVDIVDGHYISVVLLPGLEGRRTKFSSLEQCKNHLKYQVHVWLSFAGAYPVVTQRLAENWVNLGIQSGGIVGKEGRINVLTWKPKGKRSVITWSSYD